MPRTASPALKAPLWLLAMVTIGGTLAMHMFIPALPDAARQLGSSNGQMQQTITVYIMGMALGQLIYGPMSDALGRRPVLLAGLSLYTVASLLAFIAPSTDMLIGARLLQALGGCAGLALGRAIARDTATPENAVGSLALLNLMMMMGPGISPSIGSGLDAVFGWRSIFAALALMGLVTAICVWRLLPETGRPTGQLNWRTVRTDYRTLLGSPQFLGFAIGGGGATTSLYAFIAAAPFIFIEQLHTSKAEVGLILGLLMGGMALGNVLARQLIQRVSLDKLMLGGNLLSLSCAGALLALTLMQQLNVVLAVSLMTLFTIGSGMTSPAALAKALGVHPQLTGSAAGVYGFAQMAVGGICTMAASVGDNPSLSAFSVLLIAGMLGQLGFRFAISKNHSA
ncbi:multidrug effflux MFS transporter [Comamonas suwonensis]|uniref:multidrug effflux MFS transporter n=1 Tax=Comamonas suwonensis TaxID=2606214 RepID=UPI00145EA2CA|nr:multidrug effflux MFS transporter [Comamonas suwonensis]MBI1624877.1 multidrug effflux MFS transporter [Comamonas suwonensis]